MSSSRGATRCRHPTNGRAIRRSPAGPLDLMRFAPVEAACSRLPAVFQKENPILTDSVSFVTGCRFCCPHPYTSQGRGSVRGKPLRVSPLAFSHPPAGDHFCTAKVPHQKRRGTRTCVSSFLVRAMGLEPTRPYGHKHLKLACLPIPARSRTRYLIIIAKPGSLSSTGGKFTCRR